MAKNKHDIDLFRRIEEEMQGRPCTRQSVCLQSTKYRRG